MATRSPRSQDTLLFVDTNVLLDFYRFPRSDVSLRYVDQLEACKDRLILTAQVEMEYKKNRQKVISETLKGFTLPDWSKLTPPPLVADLQAAKTIVKCRTEISKQHKRLLDRMLKILRTPAVHDPVYQMLQRLFKYDSSLSLSRAKKERHEIRELARKRFQLGYPPRKSDDTSIGDAVNWEWVVRCAEQTGKHVVIVTRDSDYGAIRPEGSYLNDFLRHEFGERLNKKRKLTLTDKLSEGLRRVNAPVSRAMERDEIALLSSGRRMTVEETFGNLDP